MGDDTRKCPACGRAVDVQIVNCPACGGRWNADGRFTPFELPRGDRLAGGVEGGEVLPGTDPPPVRRQPGSAEQRRRLFLIAGIALVDVVIAAAVIILYVSGVLD